MASIVRTEHLTKDFSAGFWRSRPQRALDDVSIEVPAGGVFGLLGPNGAGKSTTLKVLVGLLKPTTGRAEIFGRAPREVSARARLGFLPENPSFYDELSAEELLSYFAGLCGYPASERRARVTRALDLVGLGDDRHRRLRQYSKGMVQRVGIAQALVNDPELVILDEPMSGLDPVGRHDVRQIIVRLRDEGRTVVFSSHILPDAELLCTRVCILAKGRVVAFGGLVGTDRQRLPRLGSRLRWPDGRHGVAAGRPRSPGYAHHRQPVQPGARSGRAARNARCRPFGSRRVARVRHAAAGDAGGVLPAGLEMSRPSYRPGRVARAQAERARSRAVQHRRVCAFARRRRARHRSDDGRTGSEDHQGPRPGRHRAGRRSDERVRRRQPRLARDRPPQHFQRPLQTAPALGIHRRQVLRPRDDAGDERGRPDRRAVSDPVLDGLDVARDRSRWSWDAPGDRSAAPGFGRGS